MNQFQIVGYFLFRSRWDQCYHYYHTLGQNEVGRIVTIWRSDVDTWLRQDGAISALNALYSRFVWLEMPTNESIFATQCTVHSARKLYARTLRFAARK